MYNRLELVHLADGNIPEAILAVIRGERWAITYNQASRVPIFVQIALR
jgi:hypothetical protein